MRQLFKSFGRGFYIGMYPGERIVAGMTGERNDEDTVIMQATTKNDMIQEKVPLCMEHMIRMHERHPEIMKKR